MPDDIELIREKYRGDNFIEMVDKLHFSLMKQ